MFKKIINLLTYLDRLVTVQPKPYTTDWYNLQPNNNSDIEDELYSDMNTEEYCSDHKWDIISSYDHYNDNEIVEQCRYCRQIRIDGRED